MNLFEAAKYLGLRIMSTPHSKERVIGNVSSLSYISSSKFYLLVENSFHHFRCDNVTKYNYPD